jgi:hypothetical protein
MKFKKNINLKNDKNTKVIPDEPPKTRLFLKLSIPEILDTSLTMKFKSRPIKCWMMKLSKKISILKKNEDKI